MSTQSDADVLHAWLVAENLFPSSVRPPSADAQARTSELASISETAKDVLRSRGVQLLAVNEVERKIIVFLRRARPGKKQLSLLPHEVGESEIEYRQGVAKGIGSEPPQARGKPFYVVQQAGVDHYACGSSISLGNCRDAGTLGALVKDPDGVLYGLTNNHITGGCNYAPKQMPILAPGVLDVTPLGFDPTTLGYHERSIPLSTGIPGTADVSNNLDAAIFKIRDEATVTSLQGAWYDTPNHISDIEPDMEVEKVGRTTGHTTGVVIAQAHGPLGIKYAVQGVDYEFSGDVYFDPVFIIQGKAQVFSDHGDSGSLITAVKDGVRHAVGILIGGARGQGVDYTFVLPIRSVLDKLGVSLVSGHNI
ncbi:MAG: hypothetical protein IRZ28_07855 [Steroidobacteraceae bacterium]|nr:hypothetical protein [Steroidobacteraceae bacterium]